MGNLADELDAIQVSATAPGGGITADLHGDTQLRLRFAPGYYRRASEFEMARQLAALARLLWAARTWEFDTIIGAAGGTRVPADRVDGPDRRFQAALDQLVAQAGAADGRITVSVRGMREWTVTITPGTLRTMTEDAFTHPAATAAIALIADQFEKMRLLRRQIYYSDRGVR
jgi:hypothetical protein